MSGRAKSVSAPKVEPAAMRPRLGMVILNSLSIANSKPITTQRAHGADAQFPTKTRFARDARHLQCRFHERVQTLLGVVFTCVTREALIIAQIATFASS